MIQITLNEKNVYSCQVFQRTESNRKLNTGAISFECLDTQIIIGNLSTVQLVQLKRDLEVLLADKLFAAEMKKEGFHEQLTEYAKEIGSKF